MSRGSDDTTLLDARGSTGELSSAAGALGALTGSSGTLQLDVATTVDGPLFALRGELGEITLAIAGGRLDGRIRCGDLARHLDAEDAVGLDDGRVHSIALTVDDAGTHLHVDGYEAFSTTATSWFDDLGAPRLELDRDGVMTFSRVAVWGSPLTLEALVAQSVVAAPLLQFAAAELSPRDAARTSLLAEGALRAMFRTRGSGQQGVIVQAGGDRGRLTLGITGGDLHYDLERDGTPVASVLAPGRWDDGNWHDVVLVSGRGALQLYVDGHQVLHAAGAAFFGELGEVERVVVGADLSGTRLWGEVQTATIHDAVLSDHQVKRLASVPPLPTRALFDSGLAGARSYRIPALLTLDSGVLLAGCDQRVSMPNDSPNDTNFAIRRSTDGGRTWTEPQVVLRYPGGGLLGSSVTDPVILQDRASGRVLVFLDQFPGGIGQPNAEAGTGHDERGRPLLIDRDGATFTLEPDGRVLTAEGTESSYLVGTDGSVTRDGAAAGNIHLAAGVDAHESLLTVRTSYLVLVTSDDDGRTWTAPRDLTAELKEPWMRFLGTAPGNGIQLIDGEHAGRLLVPAYFNGEDGRAFSCCALLSDDGGQTWARGASINDGRVLDGKRLDSRTLTDDRASGYESTLVEGADGSVHVYLRNQHPSGRVGHAVSTDGGQNWGEVDFVDQLPEIFSQPNAIRVTLPDGRVATVFANASQLLPFRGRGVLRMSFDDGRTWPHHRVLNPRHHVYQSMAQLPDGRLAVLWEREWQGLFLTVLPLSWLTDSLSEA